MAVPYPNSIRRYSNVFLLHHTTYIHSVVIIIPDGRVGNPNETPRSILAPSHPHPVGTVQRQKETP